VFVVGTLKVLHYGATVVNGMPVPARSEIVVVKNEKGSNSSLMCQSARTYSWKRFAYSVS
jgi:hypothetical protein